MYKLKNLSQINNNDVMAVVSFVKVSAARRNPSDTYLYLDVKNLDTGEEFQVVGSELVERMYSADVFDSIEKVSRTEMVEILMESLNVPLTAVFKKLNGEERTVRCRILRTEPLFGRTIVEDFDKPYDPALKQSQAMQRVCQIDHRTLKVLIVKGIKYQIK